MYGIFKKVQKLKMEDGNNNEEQILLGETEAHLLLQAKRTPEISSSDDEQRVDGLMENEVNIDVNDVKLPEDYYDCCYIGCHNPFHGPCDICKDECGKVSEFCQEHYEHDNHKGKNKLGLLLSTTEDKKIEEQSVNINDANDDNEFKKLYSLLVLVKIVRCLSYFYV